MEVTLNKSWHLWLANFGDKRIDPAWGTDICQYTRAVLAGSFWALVAFSFIFAFGSWVLFSVYDILNMMITGEVIEKFTMMFLFTLGMITIIAGFVGFKVWLERRPIKERPVKPPSFTKVVYRKFKDKTCFRIRFNA